MRCSDLALPYFFDKPRVGLQPCPHLVQYGSTLEGNSQEFDPDWTVEAIQTYTLGPTMSGKNIHIALFLTFFEPLRSGLDR